MIELRAGRARCSVSPPDGGRIATLEVDGRALVIEKSEHSTSMSWGIFAMVPWVGRVRRGLFHFEGRAHQLDLAMPPHAIHGTVFTQPWTVSDTGDDFVSMSCPIGDRWPFGGVVHHHIELADDHIRCRLSVTADDLAMPAQVGWHPWFVKPDAATTTFAHMYARDADGIPTGELVAQPPGPWDDCFVQPLAPLVLHYGELNVSVESDCDHWVVYDEQAGATCVEPQSGPPDGFTIRPDRLEPGARLGRSMTIRWTPRAGSPGG